MYIPFAISYIHFFQQLSNDHIYQDEKCETLLHALCSSLLSLLALPLQCYAGVWQMEVQLSGDHSELFL